MKLNYDGIRITNVMNWSTAGDPPFDKGKKRKDCPDAFAVAILSEYAEQHSRYIAVVSHDADFKKACDRFPSLMYCQSLPVLTELLLSAEDSRIATFRSVLDASLDRLAEAAYKATIDVSFYHGNGHSEITDSEVRELDVADVRIVALREQECTVAFDAVIKVSHEVEWSEPGPDGETERHRDSVINDYDVSGTAKVSVDSGGTAVAGIPYVALNEEEIEATDLPPFWGRWR